MSSLPAKAIVVFIHAFIGWAYCGGIMWVGPSVMSMNATLLLHAIGAPVGFALLSWLYHERFGFTRPIATAALFVGIVIALDAFLVAPVFEKSFAMFRSALGTWLPFALIFAATWGAGTFVQRKAGSMPVAGR